MRILIFGLGALGTVFATFLKEAGHEVYAITKEKYLKDLKSKELNVIGIWGDHRAILDDISSNIKDFKNIDFDLIILTVKSYDTQQAIKQFKPLIKGKTLVLIAQNGYGNYETVSKEIGKEHTLLARVIFGAKIVKTGEAEVTVIADATRIGQPEDAIPEEKVKEVALVLDKAGLPTKYDKDVYKLLWDKILYNCALNPLGALLECSYGELAESENTRKIMNGIVKEIFSVTKANKIKLRWNSPEEYLDHFYKNLIPPTAQHYPSMYYDLKYRKRTEIDALNGAVVKLGEKKGIKTPINKTITYLIKFKESIRDCLPILHRSVNSP